MENGGFPFLSSPIHRPSLCRGGGEWEQRGSKYENGDTCWMGGTQADSLVLLFLRKYQFMEQNLQRRVAGLKDKMPDIQKTLDTIRFLKIRKVVLVYGWFPTAVGSRPPGHKRS